MPVSGIQHHLARGGEFPDRNGIPAWNVEGDDAGPVWFLAAGMHRAAESLEFFDDLACDPVYVGSDIFDAEIEQMFSRLMGDKVEPRREFIMRHAKEAQELDWHY